MEIKSYAEALRGHRFVVVEIKVMIKSFLRKPWIKSRSKSGKRSRSKAGSPRYKKGILKQALITMTCKGAMLRLGLTCHVKTRVNIGVTPMYSTC